MKHVKDIMSSQVISVRPNDLIGEVRSKFLSTGFHCLPVLDENAWPVGVVSSWDLVEEYQPQESVSNAMTDRVFTIGPSALVSEAAEAMRDNFIHHLVVVDPEHTVVGIVSSFDLLESLAKGEL